MKVKYRIRIKIRDFFNNIKWKYQRAKRGYSEYDLWEIDYWFINTFSRMLRDFVKINHGYPSDKETPENWEKEILHNADLLEQLEIDLYDYDRIDEIEKNRDEFFEWLKNNLWNLWD